MKRNKYFAVLILDLLYVINLTVGFSISPSINVPDSVSLSSSAPIELKPTSEITSTIQIPVLVENIESKFRSDVPNKSEKNISSDPSDIKTTKRKKDTKLVKLALKFNGKVNKTPNGGFEIVPVTEVNKNATRRAMDTAVITENYNISTDLNTSHEELVTSSSIKRDLKDQGPTIVENNNNNKEHISKTREELLKTISKLDSLFDKVNNQQNITDNSTSHIMSEEAKSESNILMGTAHNLLKKIKKSLETQQDLKETLETLKNIEKKEILMPIDGDNFNRRGLPQEKSYNILRDGLDILNMAI